MDIGKTIGGALGSIVGTIFGPIGTAAGAKAGEYVGDAIESAVADEKPVSAAPPPKPLIASKSAWFGLLLVVVPPALQYGIDYDWSQIVSPTAAIVITGAITIALRVVTSGAIGRP